MRILHVNKFFDLNGGAEVYLHRVMRAQELAGHEVHVLAARMPHNLASRDAARFVAGSHLDRSDGLKNDVVKAARFFWNREAKTAMEQAIRDFTPDIVHLHNIYHHLSSSILSPIRHSHVPCVQTLHDYKLACPNYRMFTQNQACERCKGGRYWEAVKNECLSAGFLPNVLAALEMGMTKARRSYEKTVRLFLCPSRFMKEKMEDWGEPANKLRYLPNPVDLSNMPAPRGGGYLLFVGRLAVEKGLASFLTAAARIPELPVKIVGRGPEEARLRLLVESLHAPHIEFVGFQTGEALTHLRARAEAFVLPSIWYENASLSVLEAMSDGLPCLVTRIGGNPELIEDDVHGFLVKPNDVEDWVRALRRFQALSLDRRNAMGEAGRKRVEERFFWSTHLEKLEGFYLEAGAKK